MWNLFLYRQKGREKVVVFRHDISSFLLNCLGELLVRKDEILQLDIDATWIPVVSLKSYPYVLQWSSSHVRYRDVSLLLMAWLPPLLSSSLLILPFWALSKWALAVVTKDGYNELEGLYLKIQFEWVWNSLHHLYLVLLNIVTLLKENPVALILHVFNVLIFLEIVSSRLQWIFFLSLPIWYAGSVLIKHRLFSV